MGYYAMKAATAYAKPLLDGYLSRDPSKVGGNLHGAVFYGSDNSGNAYVYTKNGWLNRPVIMKLSELISSPFGYGSPTGMSGQTGYYNTN
jgi:hypothetical protein